MNRLCHLNSNPIQILNKSLSGLLHGFLAGVLWCACRLPGNLLWLWYNEITPPLHLNARGKVSRHEQSMRFAMKIREGFSVHFVCFELSDECSVTRQSVWYMCESSAVPLWSFVLGATNKIYTETKDFTRVICTFTVSLEEKSTSKKVKKLV